MLFFKKLFNQTEINHSTVYFSAVTMDQVHIAPFLVWIMFFQRFSKMCGDTEQKFSKVIKCQVLNLKLNSQV